jgi:TolA-binding protein/streptogramin lyase
MRLGAIATGLLFLQCFLSSTSVSAQSTAAAAAEQRLITEAERLTQEGQLAEALTTYENLVRQFPESSFAPEARLRLAWGRWDEGDAESATRIAQELVDQSIGRPEAAGGFVLLGTAQAESAISREEVDQARDTLRNAWALFDRESFPNLEWRAKSLYKSGELAFSIGEYEQAAVAYLSVLEDEPSSSLTGAARLKLAESMLQLGEITAAARLFQEILDAPEMAEQDDSSLIGTARRRNTLIDRLWLRKSAGYRAWSKVRLLSIGGVTLKKPHNIAAATDGRLLVTDSGLREIILVDESGKVQSKYPVQAPQRPSFNLMAAPIAAAEERVMDLHSRSNHAFGDPASKRGEALSKIKAAEKGRFGAWTVLTEKPAEVLRYDSSRRFLSSVFDRQRGEAVDLAHDRQGQIYVLDQKNRSVMRLRSGSLSLEKVLSGSWSKAEAIEVDLLGNIYILDRSDAQVHVYDSSGKKIETLGPGLPGGIVLKSPQDITVDGSGRLFISDARLSAIVVVE